MIYLHYNLLLFLIFIQCCVILFSQNSIRSLLLLINIYITTAVSYLIVGAEFVGFILIIVYVGAISILFLFVIMMLNLRVSELYNKLTIYTPIGYIIGLSFMIEILYMIQSDMMFIEIFDSIYQSNVYILFEGKSNIVKIGETLYNHHFILLWYAAIILLVAMIGAIVLTIDFKYHEVNSKTYLEITSSMHEVIYIGRDKNKTSVKWY